MSRSPFAFDLSSAASVNILFPLLELQCKDHRGLHVNGSLQLRAVSELGLECLRSFHTREDLAQASEDNAGSENTDNALPPPLSMTAPSCTWRT